MAQLLLPCRLAAPAHTSPHQGGGHHLLSAAGLVRVKLIVHLQREPQARCALTEAGVHKTCLGSTLRHARLSARLSRHSAALRPHAGSRRQCLPSTPQGRCAGPPSDNWAALVAEPRAPDPAARHTRLGHPAGTMHAGPGHAHWASQHPNNATAQCRKRHAPAGSQARAPQWARCLAAIGAGSSCQRWLQPRPQLRVPAARRCRGRRRGPLHPAGAGLQAGPAAPLRGGTSSASQHVEQMRDPLLRSESRENTDKLPPGRPHVEKSCNLLVASRISPCEEL